MPPGHSSFLNSFHFEKNCHRKFYQGHRLPKLLFHLLIYFNFGPISSFFMNYIDLCIDINLSTDINLCTDINICTDLVLILY